MIWIERIFEIMRISGTKKKQYNWLFQQKHNEVDCSVSIVILIDEKTSIKASVE